MEEVEYYEPGDLIFACEEFAHVIFVKYLKEYCDNCFSQSSCIKLCSRCKSVGYCSRKCWKLAQPQHQYECLSFDLMKSFWVNHYMAHTNTPEEFDFIFLMARVVIKLKFGNGKIVSETFGSQKITFDDLQSEKGVGTEEYLFLTSLLHDCVANKDLLPSEEIYDIYLKVGYNQAPLRYENEFGSYLSLGRALFHRGCKSNAVSVPTKLLKHEFRATKRIRKDGSEKIYLTTLHIIDSYCPNCYPAFSLTHAKRDCNGCFLSSSITTSELSDRISRHNVIKETLYLASELLFPTYNGEKVLPNMRVRIDNCIMHQKEVVGATHITRLRLLFWKVLIDPLDLFAVKHSERSLIYLVKLAFGEKSYELFTVYCRLATIYATHKKLKIAKVYREKRNELGSLYHKVPLIYEADTLIKEMEKTKNKKK